jgi:hypothetical protein
MLDAVANAVAEVVALAPGVPAGCVAYRYIHEWDAQQLESLCVAVTPRGTDASNASRGTIACDYRVGVVIAKRTLTHNDAAEVFGVAESILDQMRDTLVLPLPNEGAVAFISANMDFSSEESLNEQNVYRASIEATYKVLKV